MNPLLRQLQDLVPPPSNPLHAEGDWGAVEQEIGTKLPQEYKELIEVYGQGAFGRILQISSFLAPVTGGWKEILQFRASLYADWTNPVPYEVYPKSPGLLPFASLGDENQIAWLTQGDENEWPLVYHDFAESPYFFETNLSLLEFLLDVLVGESPFRTMFGLTNSQ